MHCRNRHNPLLIRFYTISSCCTDVSGFRSKWELTKNLKTISLFEVKLIFFLWKNLTWMITFDKTFYRTLCLILKSIPVPCAFLSNIFLLCSSSIFVLLKLLGKVSLIANKLIVKPSVSYSYFLFWSFPLWHFEKLLHFLLVFLAVKINSHCRNNKLKSEKLMEKGTTAHQ